MSFALVRGRPGISASDLLFRRADEYAIRAAHQAELAETGDEVARTAALVFTVVETVLREVAEVAALEEAA